MKFIAKLAAQNALKKIESGSNCPTCILMSTYLRDSFVSKIMFWVNKNDILDDYVYHTRAKDGSEGFYGKPSFSVLSNAQRRRIRKNKLISYLKKLESEK